MATLDEKDKVGSEVGGEPRERDHSQEDEDMDEEEEDDVDWETAGVAQDDKGTNNYDDDGDEDFQYSPDEEHDDEDDIEWEKVHEDEEEESEANDSEEDENRLRDLTKVNWDQINKVLTKEAQKKHKKDSNKKPKRKRMTKDEKQQLIEHHKSHLLLLLASQMTANRICNSPLLQGLVLSLTASLDADLQRSFSKGDCKYLIERLIQWFHGVFRICTDSFPVISAMEEDEEQSEAQLMQRFFTRSGSEEDFLLLFTALCRALGLHTRLTSVLDAVQLKNSKVVESQLLISRRRKRRRPSESDEKESINPKKHWCWVEIYHAKAQRWMAVDVLRRVVDNPFQIEALRGRGAPIAYVVSVSSNNRVVDVTPRYVARWSKVAPLRLAEHWWKQVIATCNGQSKGEEAPVKEEEEKALKAIVATEEMPTSVEGFRKHHLYCLESQLGRYEGLHPRKPAGLFKGKPVFRREHIQTLQSATMWRREGRVVKEEELTKPVKQHKKRKMNASPSSTAAFLPPPPSPQGEETKEEEDDQLLLYGRWQTTEYIASLVVDGKIPKNKYGNVEIWSDACLPRGSVRLLLPRISRVARDLGIDYAPAMVGYDVRQGRSYPKFEGIVVCATVAETLVEAHAALQHKTIEKAMEKNQELVYKRWKKLVKRLMLRQRLTDDYGAVGKLKKTKD